MKEFNLINRCLATLKSSRIDVMTKLRMENLLIGMKMLMLTDVAEEGTISDLEELFIRVKDVCAGDSTESLKPLVDHLRKMHSSMLACFNLGC